MSLLAVVFTLFYINILPYFTLLSYLILHYYFEIGCFVYYLNMLQVESFKLYALFQA